MEHPPAASGRHVSDQHDLGRGGGEAEGGALVISCQGHGSTRRGGIVQLLVRLLPPPHQRGSVPPPATAGCRFGGPGRSPGRYDNGHPPHPRTTPRHRRGLVFHVIPSTTHPPGCRSNPPQTCPCAQVACTMLGNPSSSLVPRGGPPGGGLGP